jgi:hypothetical protein
MGGGSYGAWPYLKGDDWVLIFTFTSTGFNSKKNELLIEYYTSVVPDPNLVFSTPKRKSMSQKDISQEILDTAYRIEDLKSIEKTQWFNLIMKIFFIRLSMNKMELLKGFFRGAIHRYLIPFREI